MGQANRKNTQKPSDKTQTQDAVTRKAEDMAQKQEGKDAVTRKAEDMAQKQEGKPWWAQSRGWPERVPHPNDTKTETTQTFFPPCESLDDKLYEARERAWPTLLKVKVSGVRGCEGDQVGFFISEDGFFMTALYLKYARVEVTGMFDTPLDFEHVLNVPSLYISLLKVKGVARTPFLRPLPDTGYCMSPEEGQDHKSPWRLRNPIGVYSRPNHLRQAWGALNWAAQLYTAASGVRGEPVLSLRSGYFAGVLWNCPERGGAEFMLMTARSFLWPEIEQAMQQYRENGHAE